MLFLMFLVFMTIAIPSVLIFASAIVRYAYKIGILRDSTVHESMKSAMVRGNYSFPTGGQAAAARRFVPSSIAS